MKQVKSVLFVLFVVLAALIPLSSQDTSMACASSERPYLDGEKIVYKIYYNWGLIWIAAGEVIFKVNETDTTLRYSVTGRTYKAYDPIFMVRDYYTSQIDKTSCQPTSFKRQILEGTYVRFDSISFYQDENRLVEYFGRTRAEAERFEFELDSWVHDMVSVIYHLRSQDVSTMKPGHKVPVRIFFDKELFDLSVNYIGMTKKRIKGQGKHKVHHFQPELIDGYVFSKGDLMDIWVTDDDKRVPLLIKSPITVGSVKAILQKYKPSESSEMRDKYKQ